MGDAVDGVYLEKQRLIKLLNSLKDTTPEIQNFSAFLKNGEVMHPQTSEK